MLSKIFKNKRLEMGYTQEELAEKSGVSKPTIIKMEKSINLEGINNNCINKVADVLNINLNLYKNKNTENEEVSDNEFCLNESNYHSKQARRIYCGASQVKSFLKCESEALAEIRGDIEPITTKALMEGSYIDARVEGKEAFRQFRENHPEIFTNKGELKSEFKKADLAYDRITQDELFMEYLTGDKQVIMEGEIAGVKFKIKTDVINLEKNRIVDLKYVKDFDLIWDEKEKIKKHFIEYWGYDIQGAIYREIVRQNYGILCDFYIAAITKEEYTDYNVYKIAEKDLDEALELVKNIAPRIDRLKKGEEEPEKCGVCRYCRQKKKLEDVTIYTKYLDELI